MGSRLYGRVYMAVTEAFLGLNGLMTDIKK